MGHCGEAGPPRRNDVGRGVGARTGCSCRALQVAFREAGYATPQEVPANIRLSAARVRFLSGGQNVTQSELVSGATHLGRFMHAYRQQFGETPGVTLGKRV
ncbi:helix-turn-helix domain-containing protein [Phaeovulum sp. W22_SRMD_FR3]|uniref:helix-turn-helix domain-containing protein n=1 Tax=Phaeovulum sp. W22_SRMD_FR3 TaxID=3240274 RepID=UPI003F9AC006